MSTSIPSVPAQLLLNPGCVNSAIQRCCNVWNKTFTAHKRIGTNPVSCYVRANEAFRKTMPPLSSEKNIRDFIACTAFGMMAGPVDILLGPKLLYAAQVAIGTLGRKSPPKKATSKSACKTKNPRPERLRRAKRG